MGLFKFQKVINRGEEMAMVQPTKITVNYGHNHKKTLWSAIDLLKAKAKDETPDTIRERTNSVNVSKHV
ncbi:hypothetical protein A3849_28255 [Paenibacillus sp. P46E]|nr:hypothetical protein A3849_28255 [Paenibacillus sp. P46E]